jgi:hypothetical protein
MGIAFLRNGLQLQVLAHRLCFSQCHMKNPGDRVDLQGVGLKQPATIAAFLAELGTNAASASQTNSSW